jgi:hypothetical protein
MSIIGAAVVETMIFTALFYSADSSSRSAGEQVREPMVIHSSGRFGHSPVFWVIVVAVIAANVWYDYYHHQGILFDVVVAVVLLIWYLSKSTPA